MEKIVNGWVNFFCWNDLIVGKFHYQNFIGSSMCLVFGLEVKPIWDLKCKAGTSFRTGLVQSYKWTTVDY